MSMPTLKIRNQITDRTDNSVDKYLQEIGKIPMITPEEEVSLAIKIRQGDQRALEKLVKANLRFAVSVAKQYQYQGLSLGDLINNANIGLVKAAERFDETKGFKFISFAVWWIRQSILQELALTARIVRLPQNKIGTYNKAIKAFNEFEQENEREPSTAELAEMLDMNEDDVKNILTDNVRHISIDAPMKEDEDTSLGDLMEDTGALPTDADIMLESLRTQIQLVLRTLNEREADVISAYFGLKGEGHSVEKMQKKYGLTPERIRQIKEKAIKRLQKSSRSELLKPYLCAA